MPSKRIKIRLNSTGVGKDGKPTGYFYTTDKTTVVAPAAAAGKGKKKAGGKLEKRMYDPRAWDAAKGKYGMHVIFKEGKIK